MKLKSIFFLLSLFMCIVAQGKYTITTGKECAGLVDMVNAKVVLRDLATNSPIFVQGAIYLSCNAANKLIVIVEGAENSALSSNARVGVNISGSTDENGAGSFDGTVSKN